jgi:hypothetical protein
VEEQLEENGYTRERLDCAVANTEWQSKFPLYKIINGDHADLIIGPSLPNLMKMRLEEEEGLENVPFRGKMDAGTSM